jgi:hypothetical protein
MQSIRYGLTISGLVVSFSVFGQAQAQNDFAVPPGAAAYVGAAPVDITQIDPNADAAGAVLVMPTDGSDSSSIFMNPTLGRSPGNADNHEDGPPNTPGGTIPGLFTATTFSGAFAAQGGPTHGTVYPYIMLGNNPSLGGTTTFPTRIDEVSWTLLAANGSVFKVVKFAPFEDLTLHSPNFRDARYSSSDSPTQFADAVQRAEFFATQGNDDPWHTRLDPSVINRVNITVPFFVNVRLASGNIIQARSYFTGTAPDGNTFVLMFNLLFNFLFSNEVVTQFNSGGFRTDGLNLIATPNTYLFSLNLNNPNVPGGCCVLGFHTYFYKPAAVPQPRALVLYESWISPGLFGGGIQDVTALSHEISETFNDPFINNATPLWQFPGVPPTAKICQGNLETGDPIEVLANSTFPVTLGGYTYHPQSEALLPWFWMGASSNAINGAFSYPNTALLPQSALPCPQ